MNYFSLNKLVTTLGVRRILDFRTMKTKTIINAEGKDVIKKKTYENRITLISPDNSLSITDLKNAQNISLRRDLKLVKIQDVDSKTRRPVYKLMTNSEYHAEELSKRKEKQVARQNALVKGEKLLTLSSRIGEHDLMTGIKKMLKLVEKQYEVKVVIAGEDAEAAVKSEKIYQTIENQVRNMSKIVQKRVKGNSLRFQLLPVRSSNTEGTGNTDSNENDNNKGPL
ncbi:hypothetical protein HF086_015119 [Spodoptera exigua]|uniref:Translation initiation factor IF-3, mitochondrial n=1 Tax=Spodoptera exigua TaxID=7107 RepID=A0A922MQW6_SPOEX|nr:hypothetical protein HF086_015119 [Spodoptera exigua]